MLKNHKKINKQKKFFFNKGVDPSDGKKTNSDQDMENNNLQIVTL